MLKLLRSAGLVAASPAPGGTYLARPAEASGPALAPEGRLFAALEAVHHALATASPEQAATLCGELDAALAGVSHLEATVLAVLWDELEAPAQRDDGRYPQDVQRRLASWVEAHALGRAQILLEGGAVSPLARDALARRLIGPSLAQATLPLRAELLALCDAAERAQLPLVPAHWQKAVQFLPMVKTPATEVTTPGQGPRYLHDTTHDQYFRLASHFTKGSYMKLRYAVDEKGQPWVFRVGHFVPKTVRTGVGLLEGEMFFREMAAMDLASSPLRPQALFAHSYGRVFAQMQPIVMDFFDLRELLDQDPSLQKPATSLVRQTTFSILSVLAKLAAKDLGHYDVKPENVFFDLGGRGQLGDYGLAMATSEVEGPRGTFGYMAPELVQAQRGEITPRVDLWSLGMFVWYMLAPDALLATPLGQAKTSEKLEAAVPTYAAWAGVALAQKGAPAGGLRSRFKSLWRGSDAADPYAFAYATALKTDPKLARLILPLTLQVEPQARASASELATAMVQTFGLGNLQSSAGGESLLGQIYARHGNAAALAAAELARLPARPQAAALRHTEEGPQ